MSYAPRSHTFRSSAFGPTHLPAALVLSILAFGSGPVLAQQQQEQQEQQTRGAMVDGTGNPVRFSPEATFVQVDAETVDLRQVFDDLGPIAQLWYQHVQTLSNPFFQGRAPESRGKAIASEYVEFYLRQYGLEPAFGAGNIEETPGGALEEAARTSFRQPFDFNYAGTRMRAQVRDELLAINDQPLDSRSDFAILGVSGSGHVTAPITFVGYAIEDGPDGYSSFDEDTDLSGRIALVLRYEPLTDDGQSRWGDRRFSEHAAIAPKFRALRDRGAAGIILVNPPDARGGARGLESVGRSSQFGPAMTIPVAQVTPEVADELLARADAQQRDLMTWRKLADDNAVRSVDLSANLRVTIACEVTRGGARRGVVAENVGAVLPGRGNLADQWLVIGAHYDHVGMGQFGTSPQYRGQLHPGADDNASGTAGVLILAQSLAEAYAEAGDDANLRSVMFVAFSAEESGLHGSRAFVSNSPIDTSSITAMLNMDMIGRVRDNRVSILGVQTAEGLPRIIRPHVLASGLTAETHPAGSGRSDDANFINAEIPAMHFFSGMHPEYHAPMDEAYTVNPAGARDVLRLVHDVAMDLVTRPDQLTFSSPPRTATRDRGYGGVRLGIRPSMEQVERGIPIDEVSLGTSADDAGLQAGDVLLAWNGDAFDGLADLAVKLRAHEPGDVVVVTILREGEEMEIEVTLKSGE